MSRYSVFARSIAAQIPHDAAQPCCMKSASASQRPSFAQFTQSVCMSAHTTEPTPHVAAQLRIIIVGFATHSPSARHMRQIGVCSLSTTSSLLLQIPHEREQAPSVKLEFELHSPSAAHAAQPANASTQRRLQTPDDTGQFTAIQREFDSSCPCRIQSAQ